MPSSLAVFSNKQPVSSRLNIWTTPVVENHIQPPLSTDLVLDDFKIWEDDSSLSLDAHQQLVPLVPEVVAPPLLLTPLEYNLPLSGNEYNLPNYHQQQQLLNPQYNQLLQYQHTPRRERERFRMPSKKYYNNAHQQQNRAYRGGSICNSSDGSTSGSNSDIADSIMNMKIGYWKPLPKQSCGFCYIQYKRHCQKLGIAYPRPTDPGFWTGHYCKDEKGDVICPELSKMTCPLCFATGPKAHTLKFCPLNKGKYVV